MCNQRLEKTDTTSCTNTVLIIVDLGTLGKNLNN